MVRIQFTSHIFLNKSYSTKFYKIFNKNFFQSQNVSLKISQHKTIFFKNFKSYLPFKILKLSFILNNYTLNLCKQLSRLLYPTLLFNNSYMFYHFNKFFSKKKQFNKNQFTVFSGKENLLRLNTLSLNFKRNRFFPTLFNKTLNHTYASLSLGLFLPFFIKPKSFKKSKQLYLLLTQFFHKLLKCIRLTEITLLVKFIPKYLLELVSILLTSTSSNNTNHLRKNVSKHQ